MVKSEVKVKPEDLTRAERSVLLYAESCLVDNLGRLESRKMNDEDIEALKSLKGKGIVQDFGRLAWKVVEYYMTLGTSNKPTHYIRLTDEGWKLAHQLRKERSKRLINENTKESLRKA